MPLTHVAAAVWDYCCAGYCPRVGLQALYLRRLDAAIVGFVGVVICVYFAALALFS